MAVSRFEYALAQEVPLLAPPTTLMSTYTIWAEVTKENTLNRITKAGFPSIERSMLLTLGGINFKKQM